MAFSDNQFNPFSKCLRSVFYLRVYKNEIQNTDDEEKILVCVLYLETFKSDTNFDLIV